MAPPGPQSVRGRPGVRARRLSSSQCACHDTTPPSRWPPPVVTGQPGTSVDVAPADLQQSPPLPLLHHFHLLSCLPSSLLSLFP